MNDAVAGMNQHTSGSLYTGQRLSRLRMRKMSILFTSVPPGACCSIPIYPISMHIQKDVAHFFSFAFADCFCLFVCCLFFFNLGFTVQNLRTHDLLG